MVVHVQAVSARRKAMAKARNSAAAVAAMQTGPISERRHSKEVLEARLGGASEGGEDPAEKQAALKRAMNAILVYIVFIIVYVCSTSESIASRSIFFFSDALKSQFLGVEMKEEFSPSFDKTFADIATVEELYHWLQSGFSHSAFSPHTFNGIDLGAGRMSPGYTLGPNKIVGAVRISQVRKKRGPCTESPSELGLNGHQFYCLGEGFESGEPLGPHGNLTWNHKWVSDAHNTTREEDWASTGFDNDANELSYYQFERAGIKLSPQYERLPADSVEKERATSHSGYFGKRLESSYESPAWAVLLDPTAPEKVNEQAVVALAKGRYIDQQTTALFVDLTVYNPNLDYMCVIKLVAELPPGGGVYTSWEFHVVRVYNRYTAEDTRYFVLNIAVGVFYGYYFVNEIFELRQKGFTKALMGGANSLLVMLNVLLYCAGLVYRTKMHTLAPSDLNIDSSDFANYWPCGQCARWVIRLSSTNCFINFFQGVEHLSYVPTFALLGDTIKVAAPDLLGFMFVFVLVGYGFVQAHCMVFRDRIAGYRSITHTSYSLLSALLGDFDFNELYEADNVLGPFYFIFFIGLAVFVVLNMVIAIISDAYSVCSEEMRKKQKVNLTKELYHHIVEELLEKLPCGVGMRIRQQRLAAEKRVNQSKQRATKLRSKFGQSIRGPGFKASGSKSAAIVPEEETGSILVMVTPGQGVGAHGGAEGNKGAAAAALGNVFEEEEGGIGSEAMGVEGGETGLAALVTTMKQVIYDQQEQIEEQRSQIQVQQTQVAQMLGQQAEVMAVLKAQAQNTAPRVQTLV
jgi:hypothetical protein